MLISFEIQESGASEELDIFVDEEGLTALLAQLQFLREGRTEHVHLMAESWGGTHLQDVPVNASAKPLRHVKVTLRSA